MTQTSQLFGRLQGGSRMKKKMSHGSIKVTRLEHPHVAACLKGHEKDMSDPPGVAKAREMLHHGTVHGKKLTKKQRGLFGAIASGKRLKKKF
jgi:hypothetical protein